MPAAGRRVVAWAGMAAAHAAASGLCMPEASAQGDRPHVQQPASGGPRALSRGDLRGMPGLDQRRRAGGEGVGQAGGAAWQRAVGSNRVHDRAGSPAGLAAGSGASADRTGAGEGGRSRASPPAMAARGDHSLRTRAGDGLQQLQGVPKQPMAGCHGQQAAPVLQGTLAERRLLRQYQAALRIARRRQGSPSRAWADPEPNLE